MQIVPTEHLFFRFCERIRDLVDKDFLSISHKFVVRKTRIVHLYILLDMLRSTGNGFILKLGWWKWTVVMVPASYRHLIFTLHKAMLHEAIHNNDFWRNKVSQHCCDVVLNSCNMVATLQRRVELIIIVTLSPLADTSPKQTLISRAPVTTLKISFSFFCS